MILSKTKNNEDIDSLFINNGEKAMIEGTVMMLINSKPTTQAIRVKEKRT